MSPTSTIDRPVSTPVNRFDSMVIDLERARGVSTPAEAASWFDAVYREASGEPARVPWAREGPCPFLVAWLNARAPALVRPGGRVAVVGCGLGHDAVELINRGYDVCAFDCSPTAVEWARRLHPEHAEAFATMDLFRLPTRMQRRFDFVVEVYTLQSTPLAMREALARPMADLLGPNAVLLAISECRDPATPLEDAEGPPYPLSASELTGLFERAGLTPLSPPDDFEDDGAPPCRRVRCAFRRA